MQEGDDARPPRGVLQGKDVGGADRCPRKLLRDRTGVGDEEGRGR
jgi:hypothetical protein